MTVRVFMGVAVRVRVFVSAPAVARIGGVCLRLFYFADWTGVFFMHRAHLRIPSTAYACAALVSAAVRPANSGALLRLAPVIQVSGKCTRQTKDQGPRHSKDPPRTHQGPRHPTTAAPVVHWLLLAIVGRLGRFRVCFGRSWNGGRVFAPHGSYQGKLMNPPPVTYRIRKVNLRDW